MGGAGIHFKLFRGSTSPIADASRKDIADLWFALSRVSWSSLVLVPADEGGSASEVATALAEFGGRLRDAPITAIVADSMDFESARILSDLQQRVGFSPIPRERVTVEAEVVDAEQPRGAAPPASEQRAIERTGYEATALNPGAVVVAIQPVVVEPLGVAIAQAASAVVLCVELGKTRLASARRTIELIGADRIVGAFLIR